MTIDEAIKHAEEVAKDQEELYRLCPASESEIFHCDGTKDCKTLKNGKNKGCQKCAAEHRQLAEWLKELKAHREAWEKVLDEMKDVSIPGQDAEYVYQNIYDIIRKHRPKDGDAE